MKIMNIGVLKEEGIQQMTLATSRLRHSNLIVTSNRRITLIEYKLLKGPFNLRSTIINDKKAFKLTILKMKGYASLWYENLKKKGAKEAKAKTKT